MATDLDPDRVAGRLASAELELTAKGYAEDLVQAALDRCSAYAASMVKSLRPEIRQQAYEDILNDQLRGAERWIENFKAGLER